MNNGELRTVLVTGCSSGIGRCVASGLRERGYRVFASARDPDDVARLASGGLESLRLDLTESDSIRAAVEELLERTDGQLYGLFNNAGFGQPGALEDLPRAALREQFETNLFGTHELTRAIIPVMRRHGAGRIIQNSSVLGLVAMPYRGAYTASKFALEGLTDTLRQELAGSGIEVVLIEPGPILSRFRSNAYRAFQKHIDAEGSRHRENYRRLARKLAAEGAVAPFTLPPEAVLAKVIRALESRRPRARYGVTWPAVVFAFLRRLLPARWLDGLILREAGNTRPRQGP